MTERTFNFQVAPATAVAHEAAGALRDQIMAINKEREEGEPLCATFGQVKFWGDHKCLSINGRLFSGKAALYLQEHLRVAAQMQYDQEAET